ncbi:hypothetical protein DEU56DRAFT_268578 [Suillus clintonianus]|uniref:uncharacterized protein n=1 Tax=Suillus clintonianus TaxID=1904413 RepID=UPI001B86C62F|nr:uncharacterized protein DEU56DRAFT_268578 [Suillus clintonianus]KAG2141855.1 hypothetical protein DEU56DRAFT_268578 [Suillus clintonianus]
MCGVENVRQQLFKNMDNITQSMDLHKGLVSALSRLPAEILSQIYVDCLPETHHLLPTPTQAPMLLTQICRRWREVALDTPSLWCRLSVRVNHTDWQRAVLCCDSWLKRSRGCLLSLTLEYHTNSDSAKLQNLLQPYINQISTLDIDFVGNIDEFGLVLEDLPALQKLTLIRYGVNTPHQLISRLPHSLHTLNRKMGWSPLDHIFLFNSPWPHLTDVDLVVCLSDTFLRVLQLCPNLSSFRMNCFSPEPYGPEVLTPFTHTRLGHLDIHFAIWVPHTLPDLFDVLSLPGLRVFAIDRVRSWPHEKFKAFLARSSCPLERLIIGTEELEEYVDLIPSLKSDSAPSAS